MRAYVSLILRHRLVVLLILALVTAASVAMITRGVIASSIGGLFLGEHPDYPRYLELVNRFGSDDIIIVSFPETEPFAAASQSRVRRATAATEELEWVQSVRSHLDVQRIVASADGVRIDAYAELALEEPARAAGLLAAMGEEPYARGLLLANDGRHASVVVELEDSTDRPAELTPAIVENVLAAFVSAGFAADDLHVVGMSANVGAVMEETSFNLRRLFPFTVLLLLGTVYLMFRRLWPVAVAGVVTSIGVIWTMGFAVLLDRQINIFTAIVPAVVMIIGFSDVVHLCSAYLLEIGKGHSRDQAILHSSAEVGAACVFTSITTFFGFVSMSTVPTPVSRVLGLVLGFGTATALLIAVTLTPILLSFFPAPEPWGGGATGKVQDGLDRLLRACARLTSRRPWPVVAAFALVVAVCLAGFARMSIVTDFAERMSDDHPIQQDLDYFRQHFVSANTVDVFVTTPEPEGLLDPEVFGRVAALRDELARDPEVGAIYSAVDVVENLFGALVVGETGARRLPETRQALAQSLLLFESAGGTDLDRMIDFERQTLRLTLRLGDQEFRRTGAVGERARAVAERHLGEMARVEISGLVFILGSGFDEILDGQKRALLLVFLAIGVMMVLGLRSLRVGAFSMIPNLLPLLALAGFVGWFWGDVDSDIIIIAVLAIGIGVDDTIHFLMRFRIESARREPAAAIEQTFAYSGRGIVMTTVILVVGFCPFALSDYFSTRVYGTMLPLTLTMALAADLLLVPALARIGLMRFRRG